MDILDTQRVKAKEWGRDKRKLDRMFAREEALCEILGAIDDNITYLPSQALDGMPHNHRNESRTERLTFQWMQRIDAAQEKHVVLDREIRVALHALKPWEEAMQFLGDDARRIIELKYYKQWSLTAIAEELNLSKASVSNKEREGLMHLWHIMKG